MKTISSFGVAPVTTHCWSGDGNQVALSLNNKEVKVGIGNILHLLIYFSRLTLRVVY